MKYLLKLTLAILTATSAQASAQAVCGEHEISSGSDGACVACDNSMTPNSDHSECVCPQPIPYWDGSKCDFCPRSMKWDGTACVASGCADETPVWIKSLKSIINPASSKQPTSTIVCGSQSVYSYNTQECKAQNGGSCTWENCRDLSTSQVSDNHISDQVGFLYGTGCATTSKVLSAPCQYASGATAPYEDYGWDRYNFEIDVDQGECAACPFPSVWDGTECKDCNGVIEGSSIVGDCGECVGQIGLDIVKFSTWRDESGHSVSLSADGSVVAIGARRNNQERGHVRVYQRDETVPLGWKQLGQDINGKSYYDESGSSVSLSADGSVVAIGAPYHGGGKGHVRVFRRDETAIFGWEQVGQDIDGAAAGDRSGYSVSLSADGSTVAIGAQYNDGGGDNAGHVRVFRRDETATLGWEQVGQDIDGAAAADVSGFSVSLSADGSTVAIGAPWNDDSGTSAGQVRVYQRDETVDLGWKQLGLDIDGELTGDNSGYSVSLSADGSVVAIGANDNDGVGSDAGHVRVYQRDETVPLGWKQLGLDIDGELTGDNSGWSVSLSTDGSVVAIGAPDYGGKGHVRVFRRDEDVTLGWTKILDIDGAASGDKSGFSVSLSADGSAVAIGAPEHNGPHNHYAGGHVRVYLLPSDSCLDACGVPNGDDSTCLDACGVPNGENSCLDCAGVPNGDAGPHTLTMTDSYTDGWGDASIIVGDSNGETTYTLSGTFDQPGTGASYTTDICDIVYVKPGAHGDYPEERSFSITLDGTEVFAVTGEWDGNIDDGPYADQKCPTAPNAGSACAWWADLTPTCMDPAHVWFGTQCVTPGKDIKTNLQQLIDMRCSGDTDANAAAAAAAAFAELQQPCA